MNTTDCRHKQVLGQFDQGDLTLQEDCCCNNCRNKEKTDFTPSSRVLLQTLSNLEPATMSALCDTLSGKKSKSSGPHQQKGDFGKGMQLTSNNWKSLLQGLIGQGYVELRLVVRPGQVTNKALCHLLVSEKGTTFLENPEMTVTLPLGKMGER
jgi:superfamily II DNA helicase RecQ